MDDSHQDAGAPPAQPAPQAAARPGTGEALSLAEALAARLCHEISGPVGALAGAIEVARAEPGTQTEALALAGEAAAALVARLRLLRAAWAGNQEALNLPTLKGLCGGLPRQVHADFAAVAPRTDFPAPLARVLLNVLLLAAEALPRGGQILLAEAGPGCWMVIPQGPRAAWPGSFASCLFDPRRAWQAAAAGPSRALQAPLTALLAAEAGVRLSFAMAARTEDAAPLLLSCP